MLQNPYQAVLGCIVMISITVANAESIYLSNSTRKEDDKSRNFRMHATALHCQETDSGSSIRDYLMLFR